MKALKIGIAVIAIAVVSFGVYRYQQIAERRASAQSRLLSAMKAHRDSAKDSPVSQAWKAGNLPQLLEELRPDHSRERLTAALQTVIRSIDTTEATALSPEMKIQLYDHILNLVDAVQEKPRQDRGRVLALSTHVLRRLAGEIQDMERPKELTRRCGKYSREDDVCTGLLETAAAFPNSDAGLLDILAQDLKAKDAAAVQHAILTGESIRNETLRERFRDELQGRFEKLNEDMKPLALRALVDMSRGNPTSVQSQLRKIAGSNDDRWADVFLYSVSTLELTDQYRKDIERISREASSPTIRTKAATLLQRKDDKR